jgi:hypothetical protein
MKDNVIIIEMMNGLRKCGIYLQQYQNTIFSKKYSMKDNVIIIEMTNGLRKCGIYLQWNFT